MIVTAYQSEKGTVYINDAAYRDASPEEIRRRRENVQRIAWDLAVKQAMAGIDIQPPEDLPELQKLDLHDQQVIERIRDYEAEMAKRQALWNRKTTP